MVAILDTLLAKVDSPGIELDALLTAVLDIAFNSSFKDIRFLSISV